MDRFRRIPETPTFEELFAANEPSIRSNIIKGEYESVEQYLDIHYRLLREDFIRPLRRGLKEYIKTVNSGQIVGKIEDIWVYNDVVLRGRAQDYRTDFKATFDTTDFKYIDWRKSNRLTYGSLVCLSNDNFRTFFVASISGKRIEENLIKGLFQLKIESYLMGNGFKREISDEKLLFKTYVMIESIAYFEAYRYNLTALQSFDSINFPLKHYIIELKTEELRPSYMTSETTLDLSQMITSTEISKYYYKNVNLLDSTKWPNAEAMGFDESQCQAFRSALSNQLALIQGPPGTGKTFIGLKIVETLLLNRNVFTKPIVKRIYGRNRRFAENKKPILVVCYTNHALDQFLEGMLGFTQNIIRIGNRSKSELLEAFTLKTRRDEESIPSKDIIGMTTTGAAKFRRIIDRIQPKIVVIEEAAEVLETHVITALTKNTEHLILIGDHQQLRPQTADYELSKEYNLDISLFERLVSNGMPFTQLKLQHRMRPEISKLLVPHIYSQLEDHESVGNYDDVRGMTKNMFFINHSQIESMRNEEKMSKSNQFEAEFIVRLAKHFIYHNYDRNQITILSLYSSQLILIKRLIRMDSFLRGIRAYNVDNFQGRESDIILITFVRSNDMNDIGFLKTHNRVNVALSRAKKGLYCVGNFDCLSNGSRLWTNITKHLRNAGAIGRAIWLRCPNHPNKDIPVSNVKYFNKKSLFGGCAQEYSHLLECGHTCPIKVCHVSHEQFDLDPLNLDFPCAVMVDKLIAKCGHQINEKCSGNAFCHYPCERLFDCGHKCDRKCGEDCPTECAVKLEKASEECGHVLEFSCPEPPVCYLRCGKPLTCGHECEQKCSDYCDSNSCVISTEILLNCGHNLKLLCNESKNFVYTSDNCVEKCDQLLVCGHQCEGLCKECTQSRLHIKCQQKCEKNLVCGHKCTGICGRNCPPCAQICQNSCGHLQCRHTCSEPCTKCMDFCLWKCDHKKCTKLCHELCDREVCQMSCDKPLNCGHRCVGLCGEKCPKFCFICDQSMINALIGIEGMSDSELKTSKFIQFENCDHIIELKALEKLLTNVGSNGFLFRRCPKCETTITRCQAFNSLIQKQFSDLLELKRMYFTSKQVSIRESKHQLLDKSVDKLMFELSVNTGVRSFISQTLNEMKLQIVENRRIQTIESEYQFSLMENKFNVFKRLNEISFENISIEHKVWTDFQSKHIRRYFKRMIRFAKFVSINFINTDQQINDIEQELRFFLLFHKLLSLSVITSLDIHKLKELLTVFKTVIISDVFNKDIENKFLNNVFEIIGENNEFNSIEVKLNPNVLFNVLKTD